VSSLDAEPDGPKSAGVAAGWGPAASGATLDNAASVAPAHAAEPRTAADALSRSELPSQAGAPTTLDLHASPTSPVEASPESMGLVHETAVGRALVSIVMLAFAIGLVGWNWPDEDVRKNVRDRLEVPVDFAGLNQGWEVFAPNPPRTHVVMTARITYDDGSTADFGFPEGEPFLGAFREYRWRKWERRLRLSDNSGFRAQTADWLAREFEAPDKRVTEVMLVETRARTPTIGSGEELQWTTADSYQRTFPKTGRPRGTTLDD